jgi:hypothetical protein
MIHIRSKHQQDPLVHMLFVLASAQTWRLNDNTAAYHVKGNIAYWADVKGVDKMDGRTD